jgi:hypothetical protein
MKRTFAWRAAGVAMLLVALSFAGAAGASALGGGSAAASFAAAVSPAPPPPPNSKSGPTTTTPPTVPVPVPPSSSGTGTAERQAVLASHGLSCPSATSGTVGGAPSKISAKGVHGTTSADLSAFAIAFNSTRVGNCLRPVPLANFRYDSCMETRLFWIAEDPSTNPASAWGHIGTVRSDGVPSVGCDGNLAGGMNNTGQTVAVKWWQSVPHRTALYKPSYTGSTAAVCIFFAMTHGGVPDEPTAFTRAAARWGSC